MNISDRIPLKQTSMKPSSGSAAGAEKSELPVQADQYKGSIEEHHYVKGADLSTYKKVFGAAGAATMAFTGNIAVPLGLGAAGFFAGEALGSAIGGPVGAIAGKIAGGLLGTYAGAKIHGKTLIGRQIGGRVGGAVGDVMGLFAKALKIPLRSDLVEETKNYSYGNMKELLGTTTHTNHPHISEKEADDFMAKLKPGDIVLVNDEACTIFSLIIVAADGKADFNHALLYEGDGKTIESRTVTHGVAEGNLKEVLGHKHHAVAIRPRYEGNQAEQVVDAAKDKIGIKYDYRFRMGDNSMYCSEVVYKSVKEGAPQIDFKKRPLITREVILPGDLLRSSQADVVAEAGKDSTLFNSYLAKFV
ncbi:MAG: YiiX/YebB-like N1pC/P60 family cysteine hydrolase [Candidatus Eremiobacterota bacterium]